ncbi:MAG TPA: ion channel [Burkholderiales bacterium]|nr:ion channel [Burkholderiales bacterium]
MKIATVQPRLSKILEQRCFFLFLALLALLIAMPFLFDIVYGRRIISFVNVMVLVTAVAAVASSRLSFVIAIILGLPTLGFQILALQSGSPGHFALSWGFGAVFYAFTLVHLLHYVLRRDRMTADKLYGAVAAYIMVAILWAFLYGVLEYFYPGAFAFNGSPKALNVAELIYFSFTALTTAGFGDITPALIQSRFLTILETVTGVMYVAILIARLTGVYPVVDKKP